MKVQMVSAPSQGVPMTVSLGAEESLQFGFDLTHSVVERVGDDLQVTIGEGQSLTVLKFFVTAGNDLPTITLVDGSIVAAKEFLESLNPDMDMTTALGPATAADSGGSSEYADGAGELLSGVDRLGDLGTFHWSRETGVREAIQPISGAVNPLSDGPEISNGGFLARPVCYHDPSLSLNSEPQVRFFFLDANNSRIQDTSGIDLNSVSINSENGWFDGFSPSSYDDGSFFLKFSPQGLTDYRAASNGPNDFDYVTVTIDGRMYNMQVVINHDGSYDPSMANADRMPDNEAVQEWHFSMKQGQGWDDFIVNSSSGNADDVSWIEGHVRTDSGEERSINLGDGNNILGFGTGYNVMNAVNNHGGLKNEYIPSKPSNSLIVTPNISSDDSGIYTKNGSLSVTAGADNDSVFVDRLYAETTKGSGNEAVNIINLGGGNNSFVIGVEHEGAGWAAGSTNHSRMSALNEGAINHLIGGGGDDIFRTGLINSFKGGQNIIDMGDGANRLHLVGGIDAVSQSDCAQSEVRVIGGSANDTVIIEGDLGQRGHSNVSFDLMGGNNFFHLHGDMLSEAAGSVKVHTGTGNDRIIIDGDMKVEDTTFNNTTVNEIQTGAGDDTVIIGGDILLDTQSHRTEAYNIIKTGDGNDYVHLEGKVESKVNSGELGNALSLDMGKGDYDTLVLSANSAQDFKDSYGTWLKGTTVNGVHQSYYSNVDALHLDFHGTQAELENIMGEDYLANAGLDLSYTLYGPSGSAEMFVDNLAEINLSGLLGNNEQNPGLTLRMEGGTSNKLVIDNAIRNIDQLRITADGSDEIEFGDGDVWSQVAPHVIDGVEYQSWTNSLTDETIYIQYITGTL